MTDELVQKFEEHLCFDCHPTMYNLNEIRPEISQTVVLEIMSDLVRYRKFCTRWMSKMLTEEHKIKSQSRAIVS